MALVRRQQASAEGQGPGDVHTGTFGLPHTSSWHGSAEDLQALHGLAGVHCVLMPAANDMQALYSHGPSGVL